MVRAMAARDRRVVVCAFGVVILLHVVLVFAARSEVPGVATKSVASSPWSVARVVGSRWLRGEDSALLDGPDAHPTGKSRTRTSLEDDPGGASR